MSEGEGAGVAQAFREAFRAHPAGVAVVTADVGGGPVGFTATSVASLSIEPPLLVFSVVSSSSSAPAIARAESVVVHLLDSEHLGLAKLFSTSGVDRFADRSSWSRLPTGEPYLPSARWLRGSVASLLPLGGSSLVVVQVNAVGPSIPGESGKGARPDPLVYHDRTWHAIGERSLLGD
ncbi:flavin reductase family protein [Herbiconiux sp. CPCC 203407]|uniref:Flavin reductase family protein n=1 Tax=Herbiconiux oxytropis TaxID=2970915 RepID=A0AA41XD16_9MICO|nr:flavin reductase family protein [Herbiconiux oxytropis]MCS5722933.1 flavin reductase family protein [Herbiconiux oxytropis]MCS5725807.1 flavin reductase family protein [Herbiconiux oxytropis]